MAEIKLKSNVKKITSNQTPNSLDLRPGELAFGKVSNEDYLYANIDNQIVPINDPYSISSKDHSVDNIVYLTETEFNTLKSTNSLTPGTIYAIKDEDPILMNYRLSDLLDLVYPIGRGFIDFTDTDYSNYLGLTWERELVGMTPVGLNETDTDFDTVGKTGGEKEHILTEAELPAISGYLIGVMTYSSAARGCFTGTPEVSTIGAPSGSNQDFTTYSLAFGNNQSHNNMQPYQVVSYWKRVS